MSTAPTIERVEPIIGMEIHVELSTRRKAFSRAPNPAHPEFESAEPNTLTDPVVLALPGTLPVLNRGAVEMAALAGLALGCEVAEVSYWDRKSYFYPDLPKAYQISQLDRPICGPGVLEVPPMDEGGFIDFEADPVRVRITRAHLEEDAGKLLHGDGSYSLVDLNRAGVPLLEIVSEPDMHSAAEAVAYARLVRLICKSIGITGGVMQRGHMRFEPNINCRLHLSDGTEVLTPIVEMKNLNSFRSLRLAIESEIRDQPGRWLEAGEVHGPWMKSTRGWDDDRQCSVLQRSKEEALDYRYMPEPDVPPVVMDAKWMSDIRGRLGELPLERMRRYRRACGLNAREAQQLGESNAASALFDQTRRLALELGVDESDANHHAATLILRSVTKAANERGVSLGSLNLDAPRLASLVAMRSRGQLNAQNADRVVSMMCFSNDPPGAIAEREGLMQVSDSGQLGAWCDAVLADFAPIVEQIRGGKTSAIGRLIGEVMRLSGGSADAQAVRRILVNKIGG
ncbi:MAG TPA: Asp-tRNA(Asn)/Glu-tRNA(Gln) amidotransferase subunit GatB [Phycisphaerales bacterium]|nr:Asp-tRNA(Asn)/Glu-tRNA(Gln) amidotransferase subunit GatB [Phycisphaerales bacterium]